jgi:hypothetical protein
MPSITLTDAHVRQLVTTAVVGLLVVILFFLFSRSQPKFPDASTLSVKRNKIKGTAVICGGRYVLSNGFQCEILDLNLINVQLLRHDDGQSLRRSLRECSSC